MVVGILQPGYLPWLGFFEQLYRSDVFVFYDDVQYDRDGWRNRNRIKTAQGTQWLTVPVKACLSEALPINKILIDNSTDWRRKHLASIRQSYSKAPYFKQYIEMFEESYARPWELLVELDVHFIRVLAEAVGLGSKRLVLSSTLGIEGGKIDRLVEICRSFEAGTFYEGAAGRSYIDTEKFLEAGIRVEFQDYRHPTYKQLHGKFIPYLSAIDLLFNYGPESIDILTNKRAPR